MTTFTTAYEATDGFPLRLETAVLTGAGGAPYTHHRLVIADGRPGAVVIARTRDDILLVRSARPAVGDAFWELPRGVGEPDDSSGAATAARELQEETGHDAGDSMRVVGRFVIDTTVYPQPVDVVTCAVDLAGSRTDTDGEVDEARWLPIDDIDVAIADGRIRDAISLAAIAIWRAHTSEAGR